MSLVLRASELFSEARRVGQPRLYVGRLVPGESPLRMRAPDTPGGGRWEGDVIIIILMITYMRGVPGIITTSLEFKRLGSFEDITFTFTGFCTLS